MQQPVGEIDAKTGVQEDKAPPFGKMIEKAGGHAIVSSEYTQKASKGQYATLNEVLVGILTGNVSPFSHRGVADPEAPGRIR